MSSPRQKGLDNTTKMLQCIMQCIDDDLVVGKSVFGKFASDVVVQDTDGNEYTLVVVKNPKNNWL